MSTATPEDVVRRIRALYRTGEKLVAIASLCGVCESTVVRYVRGVERTLRNPGNGRMIVERYLGGKTILEVAKGLAVGTTSVIRALREAGVQSRKPGSRHNVDLQNAIERRYWAGEIVGDIARDLGVDRSTVMKAARRAGIPKRPRHRRRSRDKVASRNRLQVEVARRYSLGEKISEIASAVGVSRSVAYRLLSEAGVPATGSGRWNRAREGEEHGEGS